jgi:hypothetical protein
MRTRNRQPVEPSNGVDVASTSLSRGESPHDT